VASVPEPVHAALVESLELPRVRAEPMVLVPARVAELVRAMLEVRAAELARAMLEAQAVELARAMLEARAVPVQVLAVAPQAEPMPRVVAAVSVAGAVRALHLSHGSASTRCFQSSSPATMRVHRRASAAHAHPQSSEGHAACRHRRPTTCLPSQTWGQGRLLVVLPAWLPLAEALPVQVPPPTRETRPPLEVRQSGALRLMRWASVEVRQQEAPQPDPHVRLRIRRRDP
jgi:hypothetical protein